MHHTQVLSIDFRMLLASSLCVILHMVEVIHQCKRIARASLVNVSLIIKINKSCLKILLDTGLTLKFCTKCTYSVSINGLNDTSQHYVWSLESRSSSITTITVSPLIQSAVRILLDSRNAATVSKPNVACVTTFLK